MGKKGEALRAAKMRNTVYDFGFGGKRLLRLFESVDKEIATWASGGITTGQLQQKLFDTTGIDLRLDGIDFRKETA